MERGLSRCPISLLQVVGLDQILRAKLAVPKSGSLSSANEMHRLA